MHFRNALDARVTLFIRLGLLVVALALGAGTPPASGQISAYIVQDRTVRAQMSGAGASEQAAPDWGPWIETVTLGPTWASQNSDLLAGSISATASAHGETGTPQPQQQGATARSHLLVTFDLGGSRTFQVTGSMSGSAAFEGFPYQFLKLSSSTGTEVYFVQNTSFSRPIAASGLLSAGRYTLEMECQAVATRTTSPNPGVANASVNFLFTVIPEPGTVMLLLCGTGLIRRRCTPRAL